MKVRGETSWRQRTVYLTLHMPVEVKPWMLQGWVRFMVEALEAQAIGFDVLCKPASKVRFDVRLKKPGRTQQ